MSVELLEHLGGLPAGRPVVTEAELLRFAIVALSDPLSSAVVTDLYLRNGLLPRNAHYQSDDFQTP